MVLVCGGGILPVIQGWVADVAGFMASYWVIIAALALLAVLRSGRLQERK